MIGVVEVLMMDTTTTITLGAGEFCVRMRYINIQRVPYTTLYTKSDLLHTYRSVVKLNITCASTCYNMLDTLAKWKLTDIFPLLITCNGGKVPEEEIHRQNNDSQQHTHLHVHQYVYIYIQQLVLHMSNTMLN